MKPIYLVLILFFFSCHEQNTKIQKISFEDSITKTIIGKWGGSSEQEPTFEIRRDSIFYFESSTAYPYKILNQDMLINFPKYKMRWENIHVINDTLFFLQDSALTIRAIRFK